MTVDLSDRRQEISQHLKIHAGKFYEAARVGSYILDTPDAVEALTINSLVKKYGEENVKQHPNGAGQFPDAQVNFPEGDVLVEVKSTSTGGWDLAGFNSLRKQLANGDLTYFEAMWVEYSIQNEHHEGFLVKQVTTGYIWDFMGTNSTLGFPFGTCNDGKTRRFTPNRANAFGQPVACFLSAYIALMSIVQNCAQENVEINSRTLTRAYVTLSEKAHLSRDHFEDTINAVLASRIWSLRKHSRDEVAMYLEAAKLRSAGD